MLAGFRQDPQEMPVNVQQIVQCVYSRRAALQNVAYVLGTQVQVVGAFGRTHDYDNVYEPRYQSNAYLSGYVLFTNATTSSISVSAV